MSSLDTVKIGGRPIGDCTVAEARRWAERTELLGKDPVRGVKLVNAWLRRHPELRFTTSEAAFDAWCAASD
jgi:hypothetical protein